MTEEANSSEERNQLRGLEVICPWREGANEFVYGRLYTGGTINIGTLFNPEEPSEIRSDTTLYTFTKGPDAKTVRRNIELSGPIPKIPEAVYLVTKGVSEVNVLRVDKFGEVIDGLGSKYAGDLKGKLLGNDLMQQVVTIGSNLPATLGNNAQRVVKVLSVQGTIYDYNESLPVDDTIRKFRDLVAKTKEVKENFGGVPTPRARMVDRNGVIL